MGLFRASSGALQASGHLLLSLLESLSARLAISLDILSTCSTNIFVPRNLPGYLSAFRMSEADLSFFSQLLRYSPLTAVFINSELHPLSGYRNREPHKGDEEPDCLHRGPFWVEKNAPFCRLRRPGTLLEECEVHQLPKWLIWTQINIPFPPWLGTGVLWAKSAYSPAASWVKTTASI